ncbi:unnamed protein product [Rotaria sp. Silwood2]|nr:unnamed protein product [Rotaria sp. Silwood2]CAF2947559.1 unnamed protein product [Rotaria sp. Silwood2]CAF3407626.1 unnamed protein product [Rotaria sp. Silwood2]CAF4133806.1 unnamed protein product [Rotaria sp. Silwood2]CAF4252499.1 unnamed protein product [Rotaria sp. Silwood2]
MDSIEWTETTRGAKAFIYKNQKYRKRCSNKDGSEIWICCNKSCGVSMVLLGNIIKRYPQEHLHEELQHTSEIRTLLENIYKETTADLLKPVTEIYQHHLIQHKRKNGLADDVPIFNYIRSTAYRRRSAVLPPIPKTLEDIVIPDSLKLLENGKPFVIFDNPAPHRLITLCSPKALTSLSQCVHWLADGTFRSAPQKFLQSYSIHGRTDWGIHPFVHVAMCERKQEQYELVFQGLLDFGNQNNIKLEPISIMLDFELAASNAFLSVFKRSSVLYCHFHYCRSVWRKVQKLGLIKFFQEKSTKRELANLFGLPLVPLTHVYDAFESIASTLLRFTSSIEEFLQYFSNTYLHGNKFPPTRWNHFASIGFTDRTNNALEGHHRSINATIFKPYIDVSFFVNRRTAPHPNIWRYILLKRELDERTMISVSQEIKQKRPTKVQRKVYRDRDNYLIEAKELILNKKIDFTEYERRIRSLTYGYIKYHVDNDDCDFENDV